MDGLAIGAWGFKDVSILLLETLAADHNGCLVWAKSLHLSPFFGRQLVRHP